MRLKQQNHKNMKVKPVEELRQYVIDYIRSASSTSDISKVYETVSGNIVTDEVELENSTENFVYVYEH
tara:strand:- start:192 stop:395 length:204 start_codon:yes stop_codon:yes gene_type:complete